ncbi:cyclase [Leptolyngbya sp. NK1-12]|uniref:Cyclase n=1 Tax=Leptolyngbya sp. NK1-12 TaxID=2547451 RepID=A0AA97AH12_9CYAN|nr:cyclase [Leptolyngbya sp. NK1-12]
MTLALVEPAIDLGWDTAHQTALLRGEILLQTRSHSAWGGAVTAQMYLPLERSQVWQQLIDYPRWVQYFPSLTHSQIISSHDGSRSYKRLYQVAGKTFLCFTAQVEIYLKAFETIQPRWHQIQFQLEKGSFHDFSALLKLHDHQAGTLLTYSVQATPSLPIPTQIIQEGIRLDLPTNMRSMRRVICRQ